MILKANKHHVDLPEYVEYSTASLIVFNNDPEKDPNAIAYPVQKVPYGQVIMMTDDERDIRGLPLKYCILEKQLIVFPAPKKDMVARFRYCPAMKEI